MKHVLFGERDKLSNIYGMLWKIEMIMHHVLNMQ